MTNEQLKQLSTLLSVYYKERAKTCDYDCYNCELGVLREYGIGHSCAIEVVEEMVDTELY